MASDTKANIQFESTARVQRDRMTAIIPMVRRQVEIVPRTTRSPAVGFHRPEVAMETKPPDRAPEAPIPLGQRLFDRPFLLLVAGIAVMLAFYTLWGLYEILSLKPAPLP
jgi:hypothetical protein